MPIMWKLSGHWISPWAAWIPTPYSATLWRRSTNYRKLVLGSVPISPAVLNPFWPNWKSPFAAVSTRQRPTAWCRVAAPKTVKHPMLPRRGGQHPIPLGLFSSVTMLRGPLLLALIAPLLSAQPSPPANYAVLRWRAIGPFRGGRTVGAAGIPTQPNVFYIGVNNGGVWKTDDFGRTWKPIFDDQPTGSIGAIAVAPSDPNTIYVGSGEGLQRPDLSTGDGMYKSTD